MHWSIVAKRQQYLKLKKYTKTFQHFFTDNFLRFNFNCCCKLPCFLPVFFSLILHIPSVLNALQVLNFFVDLHGNGQYFSKTFFLFFSFKSTFHLQNKYPE